MYINLSKLLFGLQKAKVAPSTAAIILSLSIDSLSNKELLQEVGKCYHEACDAGITHMRSYTNNILVELDHPHYYSG